jgi:pyridoxine 4-dehydrogenase
MDIRALSCNGPNVSAIGLGLLGMSDLYGPADEAESIATLHAAFDAGVTLLDTADFYASGHSELLLSKALRDRDREQLVIMVRFGALRDPAGGFIGFDASPAAVKNSLAYTLRRLGTEYIDIYMPARLDPAVPIEDTVGAIAEMVEAGYVRHIGLCEVGADTLRRAQAEHPIAAMQQEYALVARGIEDEILPTARELDIGTIAYGVLSHGLLGGHWSKNGAAQDDWRLTGLPRFRAENIDHNLRVVERLRQVADSMGLTMAQVATAWVLSRGTDIVPVVGARRRDRLAESLGAMDVTLSADDLARIEGAMPADAMAGGRYGAEQMPLLDSER